jgi:hypothetical protein
MTVSRSACIDVADRLVSCGCGLSICSSKRKQECPGITEGELRAFPNPFLSKSRSVSGCPKLKLP